MNNSNDINSRLFRICAGFGELAKYEKRNYSANKDE